MKIGELSLGAVPRIAVPLLDDDIGGDIAAVRGLADFVELRMDSFTDRDPAHVRDVVERARRAGDGLPIIATVRAVDEGGTVALDDDTRVELYAAAVPAADAVDIELAAGIR